MKAFGKLYHEKKKRNPKLDVKDVTWWPFVTMNHFIVPLLHCLLGVGDNIFTKCHNIVNLEIDYISPEEVEMRLAVGVMEIKIGEIKPSCEA